MQYLGIVNSWLFKIIFTDSIGKLPSLTSKSDLRRATLVENLALRNAKSLVGSKGDSWVRNCDLVKIADSLKVVPAKFVLPVNVALEKSAFLIKVDPQILFCQETKGF